MAGWWSIEHRWGVVFEAEFGTDAEWKAFRTLPVARLTGVTPPGVREPGQAGAL
jgi:hypothetical protein